MSSAPDYQESKGWFHYIAIPASILFHVGLAFLLINTPPPKPKAKEVWIEMEVVEPPPPEPPMVEEKIPEPPPPEPPKPVVKKKVKKIDFQDIPPESTEPVNEPPPEPPPTKKKVQRVQGLNASSFAQNGNTGLSVRAGTTLSTAATDQTIDIEEAKESTAISYAAATTQPRLKKRPALQIPQSIIDNQIEGTVKIVIDIGADGTVLEARVTKSLNPEADQACVDSWQNAIFKPAKQGDNAVAITNFPRQCRFKAME